jgi:uncharacterized protein (TIGR00369 family)
MQLDLQQLCDQVAFHRSLNLRVRKSNGGVAFVATVGPEYLVDIEVETVHGGIVASLLDIAATFALIAGTDHDWVTVDLRVDYLRPVRGGDVTITGNVVRAGRTFGRSRAELVAGDGAICAVAIGTFASAAETRGAKP